MTVKTIVESPFQTSPMEAHVGNTSLLDFSRLAPHGIRLYAKAEWENPGGSVKDRAALRIVQDAITRGDLRPGRRLLDATSGNTGIAYAWLGAAKGFGVTLTLSEGVSPARHRILEALGVELIFTDAAEATDGAIREARRLAASEPEKYWYADQYNNASNIEAHISTTGPEIWSQTAGAITHFVAGLGTTGTLVGTATALRERKSDLHVVGVQPDQALHGLEGLKHLPTAIVPGIYDPEAVDEMIRVATEDAYAACRAIARQTGVLVGTSSGAALHASLGLASTIAHTGAARDGTTPLATIVTILPDSAIKYLHTPAWSFP